MNELYPRFFESRMPRVLSRQLEKKAAAKSNAER